VVRGEIFRWPLHQARLQRGLMQFGLCCPNHLLSVCLNAAKPVGDDVLVRLTLSGGVAERGLMPKDERKPQVHVQAWPYQQPEQPLALRSLIWPSAEMVRNAKFTSDYAMTIRLLHQARQDGLLADHEQGLFMYNDKILAMETANILIHVDGQWFTPDSDAVLPGVIRAALLESGRVKRVPCPVVWLQTCDAMAVCNSGCFVRAVDSIDGRQLDTSAELFSTLFGIFEGQSGVPERLCV